MQRLQRVAAIPWKQREHVVVAPAAVQKVVPEEVRHAAVEGVEALRLQLVLCLDARATHPSEGGHTSGVRANAGAVACSSARE